MSDFSNEVLTSWSHYLDLNGYVAIERILTERELTFYQNFFQEIINGNLKSIAQKHRHDLGSHEIIHRKDTENITQIMWPSLYMEQYLGLHIQKSVLHSKTLQIAKAQLGDDMEFDFDMLITKESFTKTETPWHSDESYWLDMPDKRALSFWVPMCDVGVENGCMWFVPGSHKQPLKKHRPVKQGEHVMMTDECSCKDGIPIPLNAGGCTIHAGRTLHFTGGNGTNTPRRVYIVNYRPQAMVNFERAHQFDHGKSGLESIRKSH